MAGIEFRRLEDSGLPVVLLLVTVWSAWEFGHSFWLDHELGRKIGRQASRMSWILQFWAPVMATVAAVGTFSLCCLGVFSSALDDSGQREKVVAVCEDDGGLRIKCIPPSSANPQQEQSPVKTDTSAGQPEVNIGKSVPDAGEYYLGDIHTISDRTISAPIEQTEDSPTSTPPALGPQP
jgi:hypothetical protein